MKTKKRQKMCYNCEGEIDLDVIVCPFCAADLREEKPEQQIPSFHPSASLKNIHTQQSLYPSQAPSKPQREEEAGGEEAISPIPEEGEPKGIIGPTILITLGVQLLLFGLLMLFFSTKGFLILKWDARLWYFYVLASAPLLVFGYRSISRL